MFKKIIFKIPAVLCCIFIIFSLSVTQAKTYIARNANDVGGAANVGQYVYYRPITPGINDDKDHQTIISAEIRVGPGSFTINGMPVGVDKNLGIELTIKHFGKVEEEYVIEVQKPSEAAEKWLKGYSEIPDTSWFYLEKNEISVGPEETGRIKMFLKIPDDEKYYNQHWMVYLKIYNKRKEMFKAVISPNYMIETISKEDIKVAPYGALAVSPSIVDIEKPKQSVKFKIYNNTKYDAVYKMYPYIPAPLSVKQGISIFPGFAWIEDLSLLNIAPKTIEIKAGRCKKVKLDFNLKNKLFKKEVILMIESDKGEVNFIRLHFNTDLYSGEIQVSPVQL